MPHPSRQSLLTPQFMRRLDQLDLLSRKLLAGKIRGEHRVHHRGQSLEFADHRTYAPGDDLRFIDWNADARLDRLFLKLHLEEQDLALHLLVDASRSIDYGHPSKLQTLQQLAAALGYIALVNHHRLTLSTFSDHVVSHSGVLRGRHSVPRIIDFLTTLRPEGASDLDRAARQFTQLHRNPGLCVILSDFFDPAGPEPGLRHLAAARHDLFAMHLLSPQELNPAFTGALQLKDLERSERLDLSITPPALQGYQHSLQDWCQRLQRALAQVGGAYFLANTATPFDTLILDSLRRRGLLSR